MLRAAEELPSARRTAARRASAHSRSAAAAARAPKRQAAAAAAAGGSLVLVVRLERVAGDSVQPQHVLVGVLGGGVCWAQRERSCRWCGMGRAACPGWSPEGKTGTMSACVRDTSSHCSSSLTRLHFVGWQLRLLIPPPRTHPHLHTQPLTLTSRYLPSSMANTTSTSARTVPQQLSMLSWIWDAKSRGLEVCAGGRGVFGWCVGCVIIKCQHLQVWRARVVARATGAARQGQHQAAARQHQQRAAAARQRAAPAR